MRAWGPLVALVAVAAMAPGALAQVEPVSLDEIPGEPYAVRLRGGETISLAWRVTNDDLDRAFVVVAEADPPSERWVSTVRPESFELTPSESRDVTVEVSSPSEVERQRGTVTLRIRALNGTDVFGPYEASATVTLTGSGLVLGLFENPLPAPLDNEYGTFLLTLGFWILVALLAILLQDTIVRVLTRAAEKRVTLKIVYMLRVPLFALVFVWGVRSSLDALPPLDPVELSKRIVDVALVLTALYVAIKALRAFVTYFGMAVAKKTETELDDILLPIVEKIGAVVIAFAGLLYIIGLAGIDLSALIAGGVVLGLVLSFAAQETLSNFFAGISLLADRPFTEGDEIMLIGAGALDGQFYRVEKIGLRSTWLYHFRNHQLVAVPNNILSNNPIVNLHYPDRLYRVEVRIGVHYDSDMRKVEEILLRAAREHRLAVEEPKPAVARMTNYGESSVDFELLFFIIDPRQKLNAASDVRKRVFEEFRDAGVVIPYPQRDVHHYGELRARLVKDGEEEG